MGNFGRDNRGGGFSPRGRSNYGRDDRGGRGGGFSRGEDRQMHKTNCSDCGKDCEVPFRPTSGKPVYCSDCFENKGGRRSEGTGRPSYQPAPNSGQNNQQFEAINSKLDRILKLLEPKIPEISVPSKEDVVEKVEKIVKTPKAKKITSKKKKA